MTPSRIDSLRTRIRARRVEQLRNIEANRVDVDQRARDYSAEIRRNAAASNSSIAADLDRIWSGVDLPSSHTPPGSLLTLAYALTEQQLECARCRCCRTPRGPL